MKNNKNTAKKRFYERHALPLIAIVAVIGFAVGVRFEPLVASLGSQIGVTEQSKIDYSSVDDVYDTLIKNFDGTVSKEAINEGLKRGIVGAAKDPYTTYFNAEEADKFKKSISGNIGGGIGAKLGLRNGSLRVIKVLKDNPADRAGVKSGDIIVGVNDQSIENYTLTESVEKIRGEIGTTVKITVLRDNKPIDFAIVRAEIISNSVEWRVEGGIGIITISRFDAKTADLTRQAAKELLGKKVKGIIVDLRDNLGGYVVAAQEVAGLWLGNNQVIVTEKAKGSVVQTLRSNGAGVFEDTKTVVLVNGASASASEIVAGALSEYKKAVLIGEKTYGKGSVQKVFNVGLDALMKVTVARWYTPNGNNITKQGIEPDIKVELSRDDINQGNDTQLKAALKHIMQM